MRYAKFAIRSQHKPEAPSVVPEVNLPSVAWPRASFRRHAWTLSVTRQPLGTTLAPKSRDHLGLATTGQHHDPGAVAGCQASGAPGAPSLPGELLRGLAGASSSVLRPSVGFSRRR